MLARIARAPVEESSTPFIVSADVALVAICAIFGWSQSPTLDTQGWRQS
jgi:hypothetical protein